MLLCVVVRLLVCGLVVVCVLLLVDMLLFSFCGLRYAGHVLCWLVQSSELVQHVCASLCRLAHRMHQAALVGRARG